MLWIALAPFLLLAVAVAIVPVIVGTVYQHRAADVRPVMVRVPRGR